MHLLEVQLHSQDYPASVYPFNIPALAKTRTLQFQSPITFFVGENGTGKSTLLEAITRRCGIAIWDKPSRHVAHYNPFEDRLYQYISVVWADKPVPGSLFRAETFRDFADFLDDVALCDPGRLEFHGGRLLNVLSHGQAILSYCSQRFHLPGLYILDEPEAALSPASQIAFLRVLRQLETEGRSQLIVATHSPILLAYPGAQILSFCSAGIEQLVYEETTHYQLYKQFLARPQAFLGLLDEVAAATGKEEVREAIAGEAAVGL